MALRQKNTILGVVATLDSHYDSNKSLEVADMAHLSLLASDLVMTIKGAPSEDLSVLLEGVREMTLGVLKNIQSDKNIPLSENDSWDIAYAIQSVEKAPAPKTNKPLNNVYHFTGAKIPVESHSQLIDQQHNKQAALKRGVHIIDCLRKMVTNNEFIRERAQDSKAINQLTTAIYLRAEEIKELIKQQVLFPSDRLHEVTSLLSQLEMASLHSNLTTSIRAVISLQEGVDDDLDSTQPTTNISS